MQVSKGLFNVEADYDLESHVTPPQVSACWATRKTRTGGGRFKACQVWLCGQI